MDTYNILINSAIVLSIISVCLLIYAKIKLYSIGVTLTDFWKFVKANETLEKLERKSKRYEHFSRTDQLMFLMEAEEVFDVFEKVPNFLWEDLYQKYSQVLNTYRDIKMLRWQEAKA